MTDVQETPVEEVPETPVVDVETPAVEPVAEESVIEEPVVEEAATEEPAPIEEAPKTKKATKKDTAAIAAAFEVGDTVTFKYGDIELPGVIQQVVPFGDNGERTYLVHGDINAGSEYPAGLPQGPFANIKAEDLTARN